jgi:superfamily II DNA or RNA helicase
MTATPLREDNRDTYRYFGDAIYTYSLKQGIEDGFLAPYRVHRVVTEVDAAGWRPRKREVDRYGREIPDTEYTTQDFEGVIALRARTESDAAKRRGRPLGSGLVTDVQISLMQSRCRCDLPCRATPAGHAADAGSSCLWIWRRQPSRPRS